MSKAFRRVKTIYKVLGSFLFIALLLTALGVQAVQTLKVILAETDGLYNNNTLAETHLMDAMQFYQRTRVIVRDIILLDDQDAKQAERENLQKKYTLTDEALAAMEPLLSAEDKLILAAVGEQIQAARTYNEQAVNAELSGKDGYEILMSAEADEAATRVQDTLTELEKSVVGRAGSVYADIEAKGQRNITVLVAVLAVCDILAIVLGLALTRMVVRPLLITAGQIESLAEGTDAADVDPATLHGEFRLISENIVKLRATLNEMYDGIVGLVDAATHGRLSTRADTSNMKGYYYDMVDGVNRTLDAVIDPVAEATRALGGLSRGELNARVLGEYEGDHAILKNALNTTADTLRAHIGRIDAVLGSIAGGDLTVRVEESFVGDFDSLKVSINRIVDSLSAVILDINTAAAQVNAGTKQVSAGSQAISQGAAEQASSIEQLTASISAIAGQTRRNAGDADRANELSVAARDGAVHGDEKMRKLQNAMAEINESSESISKIIKVIDDIAFQTNILALNAAVEAARAGAHGKGFGVVAEEVRNLAGRSAKAARETAELIEGSVKKAGAGTRIADETAAALSSIVSGMEQAVRLTGDIAKASGEQAAAISQIDRGIEQVSQVVQSNSATAEEAAAASEELSGQAELLNQSIGRFKLGRA
ncbi:MAG: methyl-accepting chemotaxis protein [Clostridiaceae bacterium]|nr:methyl-accepting chemotaxis protein [Eubacteriales bacterium]